MVVSRDGTCVAYQQLGQGEPVILVDGALCSRRLGPMPKLARVLSGRFSVWTYDRRGRGASSDTLPYAVEREIEDLAALVARAGGSAFVCGISSGAVLALAAAASGISIRGLALYEAPFIVDGSRPNTESDWQRIDQAVREGRSTDAVRAFLTSVGLPRLALAVMRLLPLWSKLTAVAHTLPYDGAIVKDYQRGKALPAEQWASVHVPALVLAGGRSPHWLQAAGRALAHSLPNAQFRTLAGQTHDVSATALGAEVARFFGPHG
jgi:pimeloyl-ACP methyl ester carboxylesterase